MPKPDDERNIFANEIRKDRISRDALIHFFFDAIAFAIHDLGGHRAETVIERVCHQAFAHSCRINYIEQEINRVQQNDSTRLIAAKFPRKPIGISAQELEPWRECMPGNLATNELSNQAMTAHERKHRLLRKPIIPQAPERTRCPEYFCRCLVVHAEIDVLGKISRTAALHALGNIRKHKRRMKA